MLCGIDEAGRGCLCGSLFVSGVICDETTATQLKNIGIKDSKKLSKTNRFKLESIITSTQNLESIIIQKSAKEIDSKGISVCMKEAILEIVAYFKSKCEQFYIDGNTCFGITLNTPHRLESIIKGDDLIPQISCASILAKCAKDKQMQELDSIYPQYGFKDNAGYGTKSHIKAIYEYGLTSYHRKSFKIKPLEQSLFNT